jgi:hypothetical protein
MSTIKTNKNELLYNCELCDFNTCKKTDYERHLETQKHKRSKNSTFSTKLSDIQEKKFLCNLCGKNFKERTGLWKHSKKCKEISDDEDNSIEFENDNDNSNKDNLTDKQLILMLIKDNQEFKNMMMEQNKTIMNLAEKAGTNNSYNNNKTFNLQLFLNETCKDAINLSDFVNQIQVSIGDLEETGTLGYAEGISKVFIKNLNDIDFNMRPIHCSDSKRETLYIKEDNQWSKDDEQKTNLTKAIKQVAHKNMKQISEWQKLNPEYSNPDSKQNDRYQKIILNSMSGSTKEESDKNYEKIAKNITKQTIIEKIYK